MPFDDPREIFSDALQIVEPEIRPGDADWVHTVFVDPAVFPTEVSRTRIEAHYRAILGDRAFIVQDLTIADLEHGSPFAIDGEDIFRRRGFVSDIDTEALGRGNFNLETTYLARNRAAVHHHLSLLAEIAQAANDDRRWAKLLNEQSLAQLMGENQRGPIALIERDGVFLPCIRFRGGERIHLAHARALHLALDNGQADPFHLTYALPSERAEQARFELQHAASLFDGASADAVLLWQCQVLAFLRKTAWQIAFAIEVGKQDHSIATEKAKIRRYLMRARRRGEVVKVDLETGGQAEGLHRVRYGIYYARREAEKAARRREAVEAKRRRLAGQHHDAGGMDGAVVPPAPADTIVVRYPDEAAFGLAVDAHRTALGERGDLGAGHGQSDYIATLTRGQFLVAALNGSTYMPTFDRDREQDHDDPLHVLQPIALWTGELKRRRFGVFDRGMAHLLVAVANCEDNALRTLFDAVIEPRLGEVVWAALEAEALTLLDSETAPPVPIVYEWTRDAERPWSAERQDGVLIIRGPLLDLPTRQADLWAKRAKQILAAGHGFAFAARPVG